MERHEHREQGHRRSAWRHVVLFPEQGRRQVRGGPRAPGVLYFPARSLPTRLLDLKPNTKGYSSTYLAMGIANVRAGTQKRHERASSLRSAHTSFFFNLVLAVRSSARVLTPRVGLDVAAVVSQWLQRVRTILRGRGRLGPSFIFYGHACKMVSQATAKIRRVGAGHGACRIRAGTVGHNGTRRVRAPFQRES